MVAFTKQYMPTFVGQVIAIAALVVSSSALRQHTMSLDFVPEDEHVDPFKGVGDKEGTLIWRIEDFIPVLLPEKDHGKFYTGDCYLILRATRINYKLAYDIFFWIGSKSTHDEQGSVAHAAVQLDDHFRGAPTQHREVEGSESAAFRKLFPSIQYLEGGVDSAFDPVDPERFKTKLFIVRKTKEQGLRIVEVPRSARSLNQGDCFVLDGGVDIRTWCGPNCSPFEKFPAMMFAEKLESERGARKAKHTPDNHGKDPSEAFWKILGGKGPIRDVFEEDLLKQKPYGEGVLYQLSHVNGKLSLTEVARGHLNKSMLVSDDVMLVDTGAELFVWIGKGADIFERRNAMDTVIQYIKVNKMSTSTPIHLFKQGHSIDNDEWNKIFSTN